MIIETKTGKHKSKVTKKELQDDLRLRMSTLTPEERKYLTQILDELMVAGDQVEESPPESNVDIENLSSLYRNLANMHFEREIVPVDHFIRSDEYMGNTGKSLYDQWLKDLKELYSRPYNEVIITGGIGTGKSTMAEFGLAYTFYQICMLRDPQASFGLMEGSEIILVCFNRDDYLARNVTFGGLKKKIEISPFFKKMGLKINDSSIKFDKKNIEIIAASAKSAKTLGRNVFGGIIDETDFIDGGSVLKDKELATGEKSVIELLHSNILRRMKSRFDRAGVLPGKLFMTSSAKSSDSFTNRRIGEASADPMVFCRDYAQYEVRPADKFSKQRFWVRVGNERIPHKILSRKEYQALGRSGRSKLEKSGCRFIRVPMNFKKDFERNIEDSIRDISGITTVSVMPFFQMRGRLYEMVDDTLVPPTRISEWVQDEPLEINWEAITKKYRRRIGPGRYEEELLPIRHPNAQRFVHIDLSRGVKDPTGIAIGHIADYIQLSRRNKSGEEFTEHLPLIEIDFMMRILPAPGKEIDFGEVRGLVYDFQRHGYAITFAAMDSFQGHSMLQELGKHGIDGEILSVDKTVEPYTDLKTAIYEGRVSMYKYPLLIGELEKLKYNELAKVKIDHPPNGTKDIADSVCGVVHTLTTRQTMLGDISPGISEYRDHNVEDSEWIRSTMQKSGEKAPIKVEKDDDPIFFIG
jgi:hypothetical protein